MTDDHHDWTAGRATPLVRAVDEILGAHNSERPGPTGAGLLPAQDTEPGSGLRPVLRSSLCCSISASAVKKQHMYKPMKIQKTIKTIGTPITSL
jgi:hypothetical protein